MNAPAVNQIMAQLAERMDSDALFWDSVQKKQDAFLEHSCLYVDGRLYSRHDITHATYDSPIYRKWKQDIDSATGVEKELLAKKYRRMVDRLFFEELESICMIAVYQEESQ